MKVRLLSMRDQLPARNGLYQQKPFYAAAAMMDGVLTFGARETECFIRPRTRSIPLRTIVEREPDPGV